MFAKAFFIKSELNGNNFLFFIDLYNLLNIHFGYTD